MKRYKLINFLKEENHEEKYFKFIVIVLVYLLIFQIYININTIDNLKEEINNTKLVTQSKQIAEPEIKNSTLMRDMNDIYDLIGFSNIDRIHIEKYKVNIEGRCKNLKILNQLKSMDNIKNFSIASVENKNNKLYFHVMYEMGGFE